jgi:hypothetical protein
MAYSNAGMPTTVKEDMTDYLTTAEVAEMLRTSPESVRYWNHLGVGPKSFKVGRRRLYDRSDVEAFIAMAKSGDPSGGTR